MILARWTAHPARRHPRDVALVVAVTCVTAAGVLTAFHSWWMCALAVAILLGSVAPFMLRTHYVLTDAGIERRRGGRTRFRRWDELRRVDVGADAALVSPFAQPSRFDHSRGLIVWFDGTDRDQVVDILARQVSHDDRRG